ncbi:repeat-containing 64-like isoform X2 [Octopus vulgaris]|uniref:Repeat-containing 64-like isoform X2 n=1 Tax=Octopus vulgaris TaxID=6645 RepID=A0AA36F129_OCTVU|nr:repeat-containing 64-like isoform X2 [Octopus vulgaris]
MPQAKLRRPYTNNSFRKQLEKFRTFIKDVTYSGCELTSEYRRQLIAENLPYDKFSEKLRLLFGPDIKPQEIKVLYRKIISNPEATVDWSELIKIIAVMVESPYSASLTRIRKDLTELMKVPVSLMYPKSEGLVTLLEPSWVTGCIYLPNLRRVAICTERSLCIWDSKGKSQIRYLPELKCFVSCSPSSIYSLVVEPIEKIWNNEMVEPVSIPKGVNAFGYCKSAQILATGGVDKIIRIWHPHMFAHPTGKLIGHLFTVSDICCNERDQHIISLSTARVVRVWDIHAFTTLQVLYNSELNQVITVCNESVLKVWEFETGDLVYQIANAHGPNIEITSLAVEDSGYRLASGAFDGSLLIWDVGSGKWCKRMPCVASSKNMSVLTMKYFVKSGERLIIALGWNNKVKIILDSSDSNQLLILKEVSQELLDIFDHRRLINILSTSNNTQHVKDSESPHQQDKEDTRVNMIKILSYKKKRSDRKYSMKLTIANKLHKRRMTIGPRNSMFQIRGSENSRQVMGDTRKFSANISPEERREENCTEEFINVSTQDILRPRSKQYNLNNGRNQTTSDEKAPLLMCNSDPVIAVIYQDDCIRFWNTKGQLLTKLKPIVKHSSNSLTCICHDNDCTILIAGDKIGYLTLWNIGKFLQQSNSEEKECFDQLTGKKCLQIEKGLQRLSVNVICITAKRKKVRVWWGTGGRFVGFFGQPRPFVFPVSEESSRYSCLPYDINEQPTKNATEKVERTFRENAQILEYPLVFNNERWKHSWRQNDKSEEAALTSDEFEHPAEKFFTTLAKPKRTSKGRCSRRSIDVRGFKQVTTNYLPSIRKLSRVSFDVPSHSSNVFS